MNNHTLTIIKKEFARFFGDRRLWISSIILPGLLIFAIYSFMGQAMSSMFEPDEDAPLVVSAVNMPSELADVFSAANISVVETAAEQTEQLKDQIASGEHGLLLLFPADFIADALAYSADSPTDALRPAPNIELYYNFTDSESVLAVEQCLAVLDAFEAQLVNAFEVTACDLADDDGKALSGEIYAMMLPMLMMIFLFSGCMSVAPEAIAGEKERGTIATLLVTPISRSQLALGKVISLSLISLLSGLSSFLGTMLSMPRLMGAAGEQLSAAVYRPLDYLLLLLVILSTVLLLVSMISVLSAFARSVKEAGNYISPLMIVNMFIGVTAMFGTGAPAQTQLYLIPLYNSVQSMSAILSFSARPLHIAVTVLANLICCGLFVFLLTRMFQSEKVMFSR